MMRPPRIQSSTAKTFVTLDLDESGWGIPEDFQSVRSNEPTESTFSCENVKNRKCEKMCENVGNVGNVEMRKMRENVRKCGER